MSRTRSAMLLTAVCAAALSAAACHPRPLATLHMGSGGVHVQTSEPMDSAVTVADKLECPASIGSLTRTAASTDGASCDYTSDKGVVHLAFAAETTDPKAALAPLRTQLDAELPGVAEKATIQVISEKDADGREHSKVDMPFMHVEDDGRGADGRKHAKVDMPFLHVEDNGDGHSHVRLMGINIESHDRPDRHHHDDADKDDDDGDVSTGNTTAVSSTVAPEKRGLEFVYVLVSGKPSPQGFHVAGYIAKGPPKGKLVVATFHYKADESFNDGDRHHHDNDIDQLMSLNVKPS